MRTMETIEVNAKINKVLHMVEKNREPVVILRNGTSQCMLRPTSKIEQQMFRLLRRRKAKINR